MLGNSRVVREFVHNDKAIGLCHNWAMWDRVRNFALRSLPYLISIAGGVILFSISLDNVHDPAVEALISNISASLLAIPLVFLLYDYTTKRVSRQLQKTLANGVNDKINTVVLHIILILRKILGIRGRVTIGNVAVMRKISETRIARQMRMRTEYTKEIHQYYQELESIILGYGKENILTPDQLRLLTELARDVARLVGMHRIGGHRHVIAGQIKNIIMEITDWMDSDPSISKNFEQLLNSGVIKNKQ